MPQAFSWRLFLFGFLLLITSNSAVADCWIANSGSSLGNALAVRGVSINNPAPLIDQFSVCQPQLAAAVNNIANNPAAITTIVTAINNSIPTLIANNPAAVSAIINYLPTLIASYPAAANTILNFLPTVIGILDQLGIDPSLIAILSQIAPWRKIGVGQITQVQRGYDGYVYGLGLDHRIWREPVSTPAGTQGWSPVGNPWVSQFVIGADGYIYGVGSNNAVFRQQISNPVWQAVGVGWVSQIQVGNDGYVYGLGGDHRIWRESVWTPGGTQGWTPLGQPWVSQFAIGRDQYIYGVGGDHQVYREKISNPIWQGIGVGYVTQIDLGNDGYIYGLGGDKRVWREKVSTPAGKQGWYIVTSPYVTDFSIGPDGYIYGVGGDLVAYSHVGTKPQSPITPPTCGFIKMGTVMHEGDSVISCDGRFNLVMQGDGNLVIYRGNSALWASNTVNSDSSTNAYFQYDGNFVIYTKKGPIWASNTAGNYNDALLLQNDSNLVVYQNGYGTRPIWAAGSVVR